MILTPKTRVSVLQYSLKHSNVLGGFQGRPFQLLGDSPANFVNKLTRGHPCILCDQTFNLVGMSDSVEKVGSRYANLRCPPPKKWYGTHYCHRLFHNYCDLTLYRSYVEHTELGIFKTYSLIFNLNY